jgi:hypothetical protein
MTDAARMDVWAQGAAYERYVGRWSRLVADDFLRWIDIPPARAFLDVGCLHNVETEAIDIPTVFENFDDYWSPFLGGQGPAPGYCMSLSEPDRVALRERIRTSLPRDSGGRIRLIARAWAVQGTV